MTDKRKFLILAITLLMCLPLSFFENSLSRDIAFVEKMTSLSAEHSDNCTFSYSGHLHSESLNCYLDYFAHAMPIKYPVSDPQRTRTLSGLRWMEGPAPIPIFIMFKDRLSVLLETLRNLYRYIGTPYEIVIIHDNSSFPKAVHFVDRLKDSGVYVFENEESWGDFNQYYEIVAQFINGYMSKSNASHFILTDPDCALDSAPWNILSVYQSILDNLQEVDVVGAALRWDDWPPTTGYTLERSFVTLPAYSYEYNGLNYYYTLAPIDTTFAMYRAGRTLKRLSGRHIRMLPPLGVRHLDFYLEKENLPEDYKHYHTAARAKHVNHMNHLDR